MPRIELVDPFAVDQDLALGDLFQAHDHVQQRGLAAAGGAHQDEKFAVADGKADAADGGRASGKRLLTLRNSISATRSALDGARGEAGDDAPLEQQHHEDDRHVTTTDAAAIEPVGSSKRELPVKKAMAAGTVRALSVDVSEIANRKSFQAKMNTRMAA